MSDKPIIFSAPMVRALLDGTKTQTRRVLPSEHPNFPDHCNINPDVLILDPKKPAVWYWDGIHDRVGASHDLRYAVGDRLWVRENWQGLSHGDYLPTKSQVCDLRYAATDALADAPRDVRGYPWRPSIHMPRWASRLTLTVTDVRVQRLQEISRGDAMAEGCPFANMADGPDPRAWFEDLWGQIHPSIIKRAPGSSKGNPAAWAANPWVAAYTFTVARGNIDQMPGVADD